VVFGSSASTAASCPEATAVATVKGDEQAFDSRHDAQPGDCMSVNRIGEQFEVFRLRKEGKLLPHHLRWAGAVRGDLYVKEKHDDELNRVTKMATIIEPASRKVLIKALHDVMLLSVKPDWWTMTGWERALEETTGQTRAYQQSWFLIPFDMLSATDRLRR
jgi:hypothetical protein